MKKVKSEKRKAKSPYTDFLSSLPRTATVLACKGAVHQGKRTISIVYVENGKQHFAFCSFDVGAQVNAEVWVFSEKGGMK